MPSAHFQPRSARKRSGARRAHRQNARHQVDLLPVSCRRRSPDGCCRLESLWGRLEKAGKPFRDAGLDFGWHNHDFEFVALSDGSIPQDHIFAGGPNLSWEADIAWVIRGGADPFAYIEKYGNRITAVHVKDIAKAGENADQDGWADVGHGTVEWARLFKAPRQPRQNITSSSTTIPRITR